MGTPELDVTQVVLDQPAGTTELIETMTEDERAELRESVTTALGTLRSENSFRQMVANLSFAPFENQPKLWRRQEGITIALGQRGGPDDIAKLRPLLTDDRHLVRFMAAASVLKLSQKIG